MDTLLSIAQYLDEMDEIAVGTATEYFDENRFNELKGILTDAFQNTKNLISSETEVSFFTQMRDHFTKLANCL